MDAHLLQTSLYGGTLQDWLTALGISIAIGLATYLLKPVLIRRLTVRAKRSATRVDDALLEAMKATRLWTITIFAFSLGSRYLDLSERHAHILAGITAVAVFLQIGLWGSALLRFWLARSREHALQSNASAATSISALSFLGQLLLWTVIVLLVLDNLGVNITTAVAGLGIGGVAVALAVQNILGDLFASMSIIIDKPFVIGDFIIVDSYMGTVEYVGIKTTRLRSLDGELIIFSNSDLLKSRVRNYKRMYERRVVFNFSLVYETTADVVETVPGIVRKIIESHEKIRFERSHFAKFADYALSFETVYWILDPDFNLYMDTQQSINLQLMRLFDAQKISFSVPRQTMRFEQPVRVQIENLAGDVADDKGAAKGELSAEPTGAH